MVWSLLLLGCVSWLGLEELDAMPSEFPLEVAAPTGKITRATNGQVAVDLPFAAEEDARTHWKKLRRDAEAAGWRVTLEGYRDKKDRVLLEGTDGRLELACCRQRADRQTLVFVSWWPAQPQNTTPAR